MLYFLYKAGRALAMALPLRIGYKIAEIIAAVYYLLARADRKNLEENLKIVLGCDNKQTASLYTRGIFKNFAKYLVDFFRFSRIGSDYIIKYVTISGKENLDKAMAGGKGAIILSSHLGNWELGGGITASFGYPFYAIALDHKNKKVNDFFIKQRAAFNVRVIPIGAQLRNCFKVLRQNNLLAILGDRDFSNHGITANFFGRPTLLPKGPAIFNLRTGAPIIPAFAIRLPDDRFNLIYERPIQIKPTGDEEKDIANVMHNYINVIERYIKSYPDQWYAFRKVW
ncbi:MAG: lysophospholipid acyltransferase family protein [Candidatus Omnitrophica bacterium]|nr:lysophospholipid acyltransferase family protein [Candidatus Omnitrophota bacterium]